MECPVFVPLLHAHLQRVVDPKNLRVKSEISLE
jgi:hypothetical protein